MGTFARSWRLMGTSWHILGRDRRLIAFPLVSGLALAIIALLFAVPLFDAIEAQADAGGEFHSTPKMYLALFVFYFLAYFVGIFFNSALMACVLKLMAGERPTLGYGLKVAWLRVPQICGWALLSASIGVLLRMLEDKVGFIGRIVIGLLGMAWAVTSFLVVPVLVVEGTGPIESYRRSVELLKSTWGENIVGTWAFNLLFFVFGILPAMVLWPASGMISYRVFLITTAILMVYLIALGLAKSALQTVYRLAVYRYAADGEAAGGFDGQMLSGAFREKKSGK